MAGFLNWWDGAELWLSGRGFVLQTVIVMPIVLALAYGIAMILNVALGWVTRVLRDVKEAPGVRLLRRLDDATPQLEGQER